MLNKRIISSISLFPLMPIKVEKRLATFAIGLLASSHSKLPTTMNTAHIRNNQYDGIHHIKLKDEIIPKKVEKSLDGPAGLGPRRATQALEL